MSEYQYYEFRKIESSLSDEAMQEMCDLSSRAGVSRTSASFTYNYGDFPVDPIEVLTQYFDALRDIGAQSNTILLPHSPAAVSDLYAQLRTAITAGNVAAIKSTEQPPPKK